MGKGLAGLARVERDINALLGSHRTNPLITDWSENRMNAA